MCAIGWNVGLEGGRVTPRTGLVGLAPADLIHFPPYFPIYYPIKNDGISMGYNPGRSPTPANRESIGQNHPPASLLSSGSLSLFCHSVKSPLRHFGDVSLYFATNLWRNSSKGGNSNPFPRPTLQF
jgi:hypothetical protein